MTDWGAYKAKQREARKKAGLKRVEVWAHPDDAEAIKALAEKLRRERREQSDRK